MHANLSFLCASVRRVLIVLCPTAETSRAPSCDEESPRRRGQAAERSGPGRSLQASPPCELSTSVLRASPHCPSYRSQYGARRALCAMWRAAYYWQRRTPHAARHAWRGMGFAADDRRPCAADDWRPACTASIASCAIPPPPRWRAGEAAESKRIRGPPRGLRTVAQQARVDKPTRSLDTPRVIRLHPTV